MTNNIENLFEQVQETILSNLKSSKKTFVLSFDQISFDDEIHNLYKSYDCNVQRILLLYVS